MRRIVTLLAAIAGLAAPSGAHAEDAVDWRPLIRALASKGAVEAAFTERRFFSIRREPAILRGVLRISPVRGLSLQYTFPEASVLIIDSLGLVQRDKDGRERSMAPGERESGAMAALLSVMRFDAAALAPLFDIRAETRGGEWTLEFTPRNPGSSPAFGAITVRGRGTEVAHLEIRRSAALRIEIDIGEARSGVVFTSSELRAYFRRTGAP
ncbi:MAG: outer membrane lipoprotein carrier protein LolA [Opitutaceae bacterium]